MPHGIVTAVSGCSSKQLIFISVKYLQLTTPYQKSIKRTARASANQQFGVYPSKYTVELLLNQKE